MAKYLSCNGHETKVQIIGKRNFKKDLVTLLSLRDFPYSYRFNIHDFELFLNEVSQKFLLLMAVEIKTKVRSQNWRRKSKVSFTPATLLVRGHIEGHSPAKLNCCVFQVWFCISDFFMFLVSSTRVLDTYFTKKTYIVLWQHYLYCRLISQENHYSGDHQI